MLEGGAALMLDVRFGLKADIVPCPPMSAFRVKADIKADIAHVRLVPFATKCGAANAYLIMPTAP